ncbi:MAG: SMI1/KNR4 family protein [Actinobacteria bacterium]|nr:SMI1/KNR4 family protein [Actinomycetota bacterium]
MIFPDDLRRLLAAFVPRGDRFPDWRGPIDQVRVTMEEPLRGLAEFAVEHNGFWLEDWGRKPSDLADAQNLARERLREWPRLIPIYAHRYLPATPSEAGNPVLSIVGADAIWYGNDLPDYLEAEFGIPNSFVRPPLKRIPHWGDLVGEG